MLASKIKHTRGLTFTSQSHDQLDHLNTSRGPELKALSLLYDNDST